MTPLKILTAGRYWLAKDHPVDLTADDLGRIAEAYSGDSFTYREPVRHAPLVIGHPENDAPARGYVGSMHYRGGVLVAVVDRIDESLRHGIRDGLYARHAAQFFAPDNPDNPAPGTWYLKHIGFLGPAPRPLGGVLSTDAEFAEALKSRGAPVYVGLWDAPGARCFSQFSTRPERPEDIVALAEAIQFHEGRRGRHVLMNRCVERVCAAFKE